MGDAAIESRLLDFNSPIDVSLLDATVKLMYTGTEQQRIDAEKLILKFQEHPQAWTRVDSVLEASQNQETKYVALQVLENVIRFKWGALPLEQREGVKNYLSSLIIRMSTSSELYRKETTFVNKLNIILVQILKQDWPTRWKTFIPDLVAASKTSETLCENSMKILKLLSEEVFDFSRLDLTQAKTKELKQTLNSEFKLVHELCVFVLCNTKVVELIRATLDTLSVYLTWVPLGYIFERPELLQILLQLFPQPPFRNLALQCLTEVGSLEIPEAGGPNFESFYLFFMQQLVVVVPPGTNIPEAYEKGSDEQQKFVQNLALFFTGFFKAHLTALESPQTQPALLQGLDFLLQISHVDNMEVFKTCLDYWNFFVPEVFSSSGVETTAGAFSFAAQQTPAAPPTPPRSKLIYAGVLSKLRQLMICRMAKPEEVIVVEDENGNIVRETMKDNDVLAQYKQMRETLVYLCHLDYDDTEQQMLEKLRQQQQAQGQRWSWQGLNTLCWAIGSISGSMAEDQENRFLVMVIRDLLNLCENTRGKDNKAVIASNIMYVVGQYPKFLRAHWKFLKTVVNKLFEFMHEVHPGVQDMACDTFLKICHKCKRKFVMLQIQEREPFISELLGSLTGIIQDLQPHQIHTFYEAVGLMIGAESDAAKREEYLVRLMAPPNATWHQIVTQLRSSADHLRQEDLLRSAQNVLQTNVAVCASLGPPFQRQMASLFGDLLLVYRGYSELVSQAIAQDGPVVARSTQVKCMRGVKKTVLRLIETFAERTDDTAALVNQYVPALMDPILGDYARSVPDARDAEVLSLMAAVVSKLKALAAPEVPLVFEAVFEATLQMITRNFEDYPEHRLQFFNLLHAIVDHCFSCMFQLSPPQLKLVIDSVIWAFRHTERNIAETGLQLLLLLLTSFAASEAVTQFHQTYYLQLLREILAVMSDSFHKPGFKLQARILHHLFTLADQGLITQPLWDAATLGAAAYPSNGAFVREHVAALLSSSFPNLTHNQVLACVAGMFELKDFAAFKQHLRDFLVQTKQFASQDNAELFAEEVEKQVAGQLEQKRAAAAAVPGLVPQAEVPDEMVDA